MHPPGPPPELSLLRCRATPDGNAPIHWVVCDPSGKSTTLCKQLPSSNEWYWAEASVNCETCNKAYDNLPPASLPTHQPESPSICDFLIACIAEDELAALQSTESDSAPAYIRAMAECSSKRLLIDAILAYESGLDGEFGCSHTAEEIKANECRYSPVNEIHALRIMCLPYTSRVGYRHEWGDLS